MAGRTVVGSDLWAPVGRRVFLGRVARYSATGLAAGMAWEVAGHAQQAAQAPQGPAVQPPNITPPKIDKVRDNFYVIGGSNAEESSSWTGGALGVFITERHGVVLVDAKNRGWGRHMQDLVRSVTDKPITTMIITHLHGDHVASIPELSQNIERVAHVNCASGLARRPCPANTNGCRYFLDDNAKFLPKRTFTDRMTLFEGDDRIELYYFGKAHTDCDAVAHFPAINVAHLGDLYPGKYSPFLDTLNGGSGVGLITSLTDLQKIGGVQVMIAGHRDAPQKPSDVVEYRDWMQQLADTVRAGMKAGQTPDQIAAAYTLPTRYRGYGLNTKGAPTRLRTNIGVLYDELKQS